MGGVVEEVTEVVEGVEVVEVMWFLCPLSAMTVSIPGRNIGLCPLETEFTFVTSGTRGKSPTMM